MGNTTEGTGQDGGGIGSIGPIVVRNSTVAGNTASGAGGGVYSAAARHLSNLDDGAAAAVPQLLKALDADEDHLRKAAARALRGIGDGSPEVIAALQRVFDEDPMEEVAEEAWWSLKTLTGRDLPWTKRFE